MNRMMCQFTREKCIIVQTIAAVVHGVGCNADVTADGDLSINVVQADKVHEEDGKGATVIEKDHVKLSTFLIDSWVLLNRWADAAA